MELSQRLLFISHHGIFSRMPFLYIRLVFRRRRYLYSTFNGVGKNFAGQKLGELRAELPIIGPSNDPVHRCIAADKSNYLKTCNGSDTSSNAPFTDTLRTQTAFKGLFLSAKLICSRLSADGLTSR